MPDNESKPSSIWSDRQARERLYGAIVSASRPQYTRAGWRHRPGSETIARNHHIERADRAFFEGVRAEKLAEREAIAVMFETAGKHDLAELVRNRPAPPEWSAP